MDVTDYYQRLGDLRQDYHKNKKQIRDNYNQTLTAINKAHDQQKKESTKNQNENVAKLRKDAEVTLNHIKAETDELVARKKESFKNQINKRRTGFAEQRAELVKDFQNKLDNARETFNRSAEAREKEQAFVLKEKGLENRRRMDQMSKNYSENLSKVQDSAQEKITEAERINANEIKEIKAKHSKAFGDYVGESQKARRDVENAYKRQIQENSRVDTDHTDLRLENFKATKADIRAIQDKHNADREFKFAEHIKKMDSDAERRQIQDAENYRKKLDANDRYHLKHLASEKKKNFLLASSDGGAEAQHARDTARLIETFNTKVRNAEDKATRYKIDGQIREDKVVASYENAIKENARQYDNEKTITAQNVSKRTRETAEKNRDAMEHQADQAAYIQNRTEDYFQRRLDFADKKREDTIRERHIEYSKNYQNLIDNTHDAHMQERKQVAKDLAKYKTKQARDISQKMYDLEQEYFRKNQTNERKLTGIIDSQSEELRAAKKDYEMDIRNMKRAAQEQIGEVFSMGNAQKNEDRIEFANTMKNVQGKHDREYTKLHNDFKDEIEQAKAEYDLKIMQLTRQYESTLRTERLNNKRFLDQSLKIAHRQYQQLMEASQIEKEALVEQYELKLKKVKRDQQIELEKYRRGGIA